MRTLGHQQVDVVAADKILRHADNSALQALLAMVVGRVLRNVPRQLRHLPAHHSPSAHILSSAVSKIVLWVRGCNLAGPSGG